MAMRLERTNKTMGADPIMAIKQLEEPNMDAFYSDLNQPISLDIKTIFLARGHSNVKITDTNKIEKLSTFEMNGAFFWLCSDTDISGYNPGMANYSKLYVYCNEKEFFFRDAVPKNEPVFNPVKGGWYSGNNRALAFGYKFDDHFVVTEYIGELRQLDQLGSVVQRGYIYILVGDGAIAGESTYEANGGMHGNIVDVGISGWNNGWAEGTWVYIYAVDGAPNSSYFYSQTQPVRDPARGAFYSGNNRAVAVGIKSGNSFSLLEYLYPWTRL
jgi:hypothetical protein